MTFLIDEIATLAAYLTAVTYQLLVRIREFDELFERCGFGTGFRTSAEWLAWRTGMSLTAARERVRVARALAGLPGTSKAMARGELSYSKVRAICRATPLDGETEEKLLHFARHGTASHLERLVRSWRRMGELTEQAEEQARHDRRYLELTPAEDGSWLIRGKLDPEVGALFKRALEMGVEALYRRDRLRNAMEEERTGRKVPPDPAGQERVERGQRRADALGLVAEAALRVGAGEGEGPGPEERADQEGQEGQEGQEDQVGHSRASARDLLPDTRSERYQVVVHVDLATLRGDDGVAMDGGAAPDDGTARDDRAAPAREADSPRGLSPGRFAFLDDELRVSAETARRVCCGGSRVVMLSDGEGNVLDVGRRTRTVPTALARAIRFRDRGRCRFPGCTAPGRDNHHTVHWAWGGETKLENVLLLCWFHHRAVHEGGFSVEAVEGGDFRFRDPSGTVLRPAPALPPVVDDPLGWVEKRVDEWLEKEDEDEEDERLEEEDEAEEDPEDGGPGKKRAHKDPEDDGLGDERPQAEAPSSRIGPWTITPDWDGRRAELDLILADLPRWGSGGTEGRCGAEGSGRTEDGDSTEGGCGAEGSGGTEDDPAKPEGVGKE